MTMQAADAAKMMAREFCAAGVNMLNRMVLAGAFKNIKFVLVVSVPVTADIEAVSSAGSAMVVSQEMKNRLLEQALPKKGQEEQAIVIQLPPAQVAQ